ncbi:MAG: hypothetical protein ACJ8DN_02365 [Microvirga sp.]
MSWLWETERDERPRSSGLRLVLLGGLAPLVVIGAVAGVMLASPGATGGAGVAAEVQTLDCALPRNAWRSSCQTAAAAGPAAPAPVLTVDESPPATGAVSRKTARASTRPAKPDAVAAALPLSALPETETAPAPLAAVPEAEMTPKPEMAAEALPARQPAMKAAPQPESPRAANTPARLARSRVKPVAMVATGVEQPRPAPAAAKVAALAKPAPRPRVRQAVEAWTRLPSASRDTVALRAAPREPAAGSAAPRRSGLKLMILPIPIAFRLQ